MMEPWFYSYKLIFLFIHGPFKLLEAERHFSLTKHLRETVYTESGPIRGKEEIRNGQKQIVFLGIPYAQAPIGKLRFQPPQPVKPWKEVRNALNNGPKCLQASDDVIPEETGGNFQESEDCLTLNIFTNSLGSNKAPQAVMVWIHGGGFTVGSKDIIRMDAIVAEDIVLVAINYRLGALGFLSFGNDIVSGNMGLKDQNLALKWVQANIQHFGGDPNKITIFGESAGGISVSAQVLSPYNSGLLRGAIAQSGSALKLGDPGTERKFAKNAAVALGCPPTLNQRTLQCLQTIEDFKKVERKITDTGSCFEDSNCDLKFVFWPAVDSYSSNPFLPLDPLEAMISGEFNKIPFMSGTVTYDGVMITGPLSLQGIQGPEVLRLMEKPAKRSNNLHFGQDELFNRIAIDFYNHTTGDSRLELEKPAIDFFTDAVFLSADQKSVHLMSRHMKNVYNFHLTQQINQSYAARDFNLPIEFTPGHADDVPFLITDGELVKQEEFSEEERLTSSHMVRFWTNFAKFGNPTPVSEDDEGSGLWYPVTPSQKVCVVV